PYLYSINGGTPQSSGFFSGLAPGTYAVSVTDAAGCTATGTADIDLGLPPVLLLGEVIHATCGVDNGSIEVSATGGTPDYTYSIAGVSYGLSGLFPGLGAGNYGIYLLDASGCGDTLAVSVAAAGAPVIDDIDIVSST